MNISARDKKILIVFVGALVLILVYFFAFKPTMEACDSIKEQNLQLTNRINELRAMEAKKDEYVSETERMTREINVILQKYPSYLLEENNIMDVVSIEDKLGVEVYSLTLAEPMMVDVVSENTSEVTDSISQMYGLVDINVNYSYNASYENVKKMIRAINEDKNKKSISSLTASFNEETGKLTGAVSYESYYINGQEKEYNPADIPSMKQGTSNIFGTVH